MNATSRTANSAAALRPKIARFESRSTKAPTCRYLAEQFTGLLPVARRCDSLPALSARKDGDRNVPKTSVACDQSFTHEPWPDST